MFASMLNRLFTPWHGADTGPQLARLSNLEFVDQLLITAEWTDALQNEKLAQGSYSLPVLGIELQTSWPPVLCPTNWAMIFY